MQDSAGARAAKRSLEDMASACGSSANRFAVLADAGEVEEGEMRDDTEASPSATDGFQLPTQQKRKQKKLAKQVEAGKASAEQIRHVLGPSARASVEVKKSEIRGQLKMRSATDLVMYLLTLPGHPESARLNPVVPTWVLVKNKPLVQRVVLALAPGLDEATWKAHAACFPNLHRLCPASGPNAPVPMRAPGTRARISSPVHALLMYPVKKPSKGRGRPAPAGEEAPEAAWGPEQLLATRQQLEENGFPIFPLPGAPPSGPDPPAVASASGDGPAAPPGPAGLRGYLQTAARPAAPASAGGEAARLLALDCEMVTTGEGLALARWTLVDAEGRVVADEHVKPAAAVTDYNTRWSGITAETLRGVSRTLEEARAAFLTLVDAGAILVGHSLENDLHAMKVVHERVIDTSLVFEHPRGPPYKSALRHLAAKYLDLTIQGGNAGHDSAEDARAAMRLVQLKLEKGPRFGEAGQEDMESVFRLLSAQGRSVAMYDRPAAMRMWLAGTPLSALPCNSDAEVAARLCREMAGAGEGEGRGHALSWVHLQDLNAFLNECARTVDLADAAALDAIVEGRPGAHGRLPDPAPPARRPQGEGPGAGGGAGAEEAEGQLAVQLELLDARVGEVHAALPPDTLFLLCTGHGNMGLVSRLAAYKTQCERARADGAADGPVWTERHEQALAAANQRAGNALCFVLVK